MRPKERRDGGQKDLFRARLDQIVDMSHPLAKLARTIDWGFLETSFGTVYADVPGRPPLPTRLMAGLAILKHTHDLSDEALCDRWLENPYFQLFCGEEFFQHKLPFDSSSLTRWRQRMGEEKLAALVQESLSVATRTGAAKPSDFSKVIVDTTVQEKAIAFPTDAELMHRARERLVRLAKKHGVALRQSYERVGKHALIAHQRYAHAKQLERANKALRKIRTYLGRVERDIARKIKDNEALRDIFRRPLYLAVRVREQRQKQRGKKVYSLHAPEVECIVADRGYRDHNAPPTHRFRVFISGQRRRVTEAIKRELRRRSAVEPVGHLKAEHRMNRNHLAHAVGDAANAVLAAAGYNFRRLLAWLALLCALLLAVLGAADRSENQPIVA
jgi:IS5 family transposase